LQSELARNIGGMVVAAICTSCKHFYITWDAALPYGCKAMGFKSKAMPYLVTRHVSNEECMSYLPKIENNQQGR
jgi:hypothetical protein